MANTRCPFCEQEVKLSQLTQPCPECSRLLIKCKRCSGPNMSFGRFCVSCKEDLETPSSWPMAHANSSRTSGFEKLTGRIGTPNWSMPIQNDIRFDDTTRYQDLPALLTAGGMAIVPDPMEGSFASYLIAKKECLWRAALGGELRYSSTPVVYGLSLYLVLPGKLIRVSLLDGKTEVIRSDTQIAPADKCSPLSTIQNESNDRSHREIAQLIWGLDGYILCYSLENGEGKCEFIEHSAGNTLRTPAAVNSDSIIFTSSGGLVYRLLLKEKRIEQIADLDGYKLSAPCVVDKLVYFQGMAESGERFIFCMDSDDELPKRGEIRTSGASKSHVNDFEGFMCYPLIGHARCAITSDLHGSAMVRCRGEKCYSTSSSGIRFLPHQAVSVDQHLLAVSDSNVGLSIWHPIGKKPLTRSLTSRAGDVPEPIGFPAVYANKLLVLCRDRLLCQSIP